MPQPNPGLPTLSPDLFRRFCAFIEARFGLVYGAETAFLVERRLLQRMQSLGLSSFEEYFFYLVAPSHTPLADFAEDSEEAELFELLSTRETYFFREKYQLDVFRDVLLPTLEQSRPRKNRLSVWSAGCASGEETYSIAIEMVESGLFAGWDAQIVGSDLSASALRIARHGVYGPSSFRETTPERQERFFRPLAGRWQVLESVRKLCSFVRLNLMSLDFSAVGGPFDAIFCRNVIIYFDRKKRAEFIERLCDGLAPGGYLFLGHAETLLDERTPLETTRLGREIVYRKRR